MKILVDELPKTKEDCPFGVLCDEEWMFSECLLKQTEASLRYGITFTGGPTGQKTSCDICRNEPCPFLKKAEPIPNIERVEVQHGENILHNQ